MFNKFYPLVTQIIKYIGIPALILGSILPVYELFKSSSEKLTEDLLIKLSTHRAEELIDEGEVIRAQNIIDFIIEEGQYDTKLYFSKVKLYTKKAILGIDGADREKAEDLLNILIDLETADKQNYFIHGLGEEDDFAGLIILMAELKLENSEYEKVLELEKYYEEATRHSKIRLDTIFSQALINQSKYKEAKKKLHKACGKLVNKNKADKLVLESLIKLVDEINDPSWKATLPLLCLST
nr:hypothetical protein [uncultured Methylophaga sp.]